MASRNGALETLEKPTNDAEVDIVAGMPYTASVTIEGAATMLFHRWSNEAVEEKAAAAKGSKAKKTDNVESYVTRDEKGNICLPGEYLRQSIIHAAKFRQDPRSPRKSAMDLFKAGVVSLTETAPVFSSLSPKPTKQWDYLDRRRVVVQRNAVTRERPGFWKGWKATIELTILLPEYIPQGMLQDVLNDAGRLVGVGDFRPTFGRFHVTNFVVQH